MKKEDWKNLAIFLLLMLVTGPLIYYAACRMFSYEEDPENKVKNSHPLMQTREGETLFIGNTLPCPVVPTSLCEGSFYVVPVSSANKPIKL
ncbi:MAG: hypothetical protein P1P90_01935 [Patescibacteria group bacterium]|nr:hypothetical protein [Patescibacteria group bacterium]